MKINTSTSTKSVNKNKDTGKSKRINAGDFATVMSSGSENDTSPIENISTDGSSIENIATTTPLNSLNSLLAIQSIDDATTSNIAKNNMAKSWGNDLLDILDNIRTGFLLGTIPASQLQNLSNLLAKQKKNATDPKLINILNEIEMRSLVELTKLQYNIR